MTEARLPGFLLSLLLHLALFALVIFLPMLVPPPPPPQFGPPMILGPVTIGKEGRPTTGKQLPRDDSPSRQTPKPVERQEPVETPQSKPVPKPNVEEPPKQTAVKKPTVDPKAIELPDKKAPEKKEPPVNATAKADPPKKPESTKNATAKAEPTKNATTKAPPTKNATAKAEPTKNATTKAPPSKNATAKAPSKNATAKAPDTPKKGALDSALEGLAKDTKGSGTPSRGGGTGRGTNINKDLDDLRAQVGGGGDDERGTGPGGRGGDGRGALGGYGESVISRVRESWTLPNQARSYTVVVNMKMNPDGSVQRATVTRSSGSNYIDSSVVQAIMAANLEPPPAGLSDIDITFNTDQLSR